MQIFMSVVFIVWLIIESSHLRTVLLFMFNAPFDSSQRPIGMLVFTEALILYVCSHYLGWLFGTIVFIAQLLYVIGYCFGWMLMIPIMKCDPFATHRFFQINIKTMPVSAVAAIAVMFASYWFVDKKYLYNVVSNNLWVLAVIAGAAILSIIIRILVQKHIMNRSLYNLR